MIREIFIFMVLGACLSLLGLFFLEPSLFEYSLQNNHIPSEYGDLPNNPDEIKVKDKYPFIFWLIQNELYIFFFCLGIAFFNLYLGYKKNTRFWQHIRKVFKEENK